MMMLDNGAATTPMACPHQIHQGGCWRRNEGRYNLACSVFQYACAFRGINMCACMSVFISNVIKKIKDFFI